LDTLPTDFLMAPPEPTPESTSERGAEFEDFLAQLPAADSLLEGDGAAEAATLATHEDFPEFPEFPEPVPVSQEPVLAEGSTWSLESSAPAAGGQTPAVPGQAASVASESAPVSPEQVQALLQALLADPVLVDALVKAVVARMGDQVLREIAWEVMPDLAGRLQR
jgi:hypothetical protein